VHGGLLIVLRCDGYELHTTFCTIFYFLNYTTLHYTTLHTTLHYQHTTLHYQHTHYTPLHHHHNTGYDYSADLWAYGVLCYEMCEENTPFGDSSTDETAIFKKVREHVLGVICSVLR